jgi:hypothetical protein
LGYLIVPEMVGNGAPLAGQNRTPMMLKKMNGKPTTLKENGCEYCEAARGILGKMSFDAGIVLDLGHTAGLIAVGVGWFRLFETAFWVRTDDFFRQSLT